MGRNVRGQNEIGPICKGTKCRGTDGNYYQRQEHDEMRFGLSFKASSHHEIKMKTFY